MRSYPVQQNSIGSAVSEILRYKHTYKTHRQTDILLLYYKDFQTNARHWFYSWFTFSEKKDAVYKKIKFSNILKRCTCEAAYSAYKKYVIQNKWPMVKYMLAHHWSFALYDVTFIHTISCFVTCFFFRLSYLLIDLNGFNERRVDGGWISYASKIHVMLGPKPQDQ